MSSEIQGLEDLHSFMKLGNNVTRFSFPHMDMPLIAPSFVSRDIPESDIWLNPLAPAKPAPKPPAPVAVAAHVSATAAPAVKEKPPVAVQQATVIPPTPPANVPVFGPASVPPAAHPIADL